MTITVASGTSTPTSMTVVATSTCTSPVRNRPIASSRAAGGIWPWIRPTRSSASSPAASRSYSSVADFASTLTESLTSGQTTKARCPIATSERTRPTRGAAPSGPGSHSVVTGSRPGGSSSSVVRSRSPKITIAAVRGIGVAVMTRRSGSPAAPLARRPARCSTPKRCCSSITTMPREANSTSSVRSAWVPTTTSMAPPASASSVAARALPLTRLVSSSTRTSPPAIPPGPSRSPSRARTAAKCCSARTSVGTIERALVAALGGREQRGQRHHRLARSDVALEQPVHRERTGHVGDHDGQGAPLGLRELVGQRREEPRHQRPAHRSRHLPGGHVVAQGPRWLEGAPAQHQRQLQPEELVEDQAPAGRRHDRRRLGQVDGPERLGPAPQVEGGRATRSGRGSASSPARSSASST